MLRNTSNTYVVTNLCTRYICAANYKVLVLEYYMDGIPLLFSVRITMHFELCNVLRYGYLLLSYIRSETFDRLG